MSLRVEDFASQLTVVPSSRSQVLMLMGFFGYSGGGKTVTALVAATGLTGPDAKIGIIDTEQKRSGLAADVVKTLAAKHYGGKSPEIVCIYLDPPFHPLKYVAALRKLQDEGCKAIVVDSMTHSWSGEGGYLDLKEEALTKMAGDDWKKREKCAMAAAARVKPQTHAKLVDAILHSKLPVILCFRGKEKTKFEKSEGSNSGAPKKDEFATPIHEEGLIYEMLISGECAPGPEGDGGYCRFIGPGCKHTHPALLDLLPRPDKQFGFSHAEAIARWCAGGGKTDSSPRTAAASAADPKKALASELRTLTTDIHQWKPGMSAKDWEFARDLLENWLVERGIIEESEQLSTMAADRLALVVARTKETLTK